LIRVRHWSPRSHSTSNRLFRSALKGKPLADFDSSGMLFGTLHFLDRAFAAGAQPDKLQDAGRHPGPLGPFRLSSEGRSQPERLIVFHGQQMSVLTVH
jgi:hypothetical protein